MKNKSYSKMVSISLAILVAAFSLFAIPATPCYAQGGYGGGDGGGIGAPSSPGFTSLVGKITTAGITTQDITAKSADNLCQLTINKGTKALDKSGHAMSGIIIKKITEPSAAPTNSRIIGSSYDLTPNGATFSPSITISLNYGQAEVLATSYLAISYYNETTSEWVQLEGISIDSVNHIISSNKVSHFAQFAVIAYTRPATFTVSDLSISPTQANIGEQVTISVIVTNTGGLTGSYDVTLKIDNAVVETKAVTLAPGVGEPVTFTTTKNTAGTYTINVQGLSGTFTVKAVAVEVPAKPAAFTVSDLSISPTTVNTGEKVTISAVVTNTGGLSGSYDVTLKIDNVDVETKTITLASGASQTVIFTTAKDIAGVYTVNVNGLSNTFTVQVVEEEVPAKPAGIPWWVWVIVGVVVVIAGWLVYLLWWRRRR